MLVGTSGLLGTFPYVLKLYMELYPRKIAGIMMTLGQYGKYPPVFRKKILNTSTRQVVMNTCHGPWAQSLTISCFLLAVWGLVAESMWLAVPKAQMTLKVASPACASSQS